MMLVRSLHSQRGLQSLSPALIAIWQDAAGPSCSDRDCSGVMLNGRRGHFLLEMSATSCSRRRHYCIGDPDKSSSTPSGLEEAFDRNPHAAAQALAARLSPAQRAVLAAALAQHTEMQQLNDKYLEELFKAHDQQGDSPGALTRSEFQAAMMAHTSLIENRNKTPPSPSALKIVFLASAIPFVGFGFLDNAIMLLAGEEIDNLFGLRLGLSTLASAGLGNAVADVIGVGAAKYIEQVVRWLPFVKEPKLSKFQQSLASTQRAKLSGAMVGVLCGCLLGLTPLYVSGSFFTR